MDNIPVGGPYKAAMGLHDPLTRDHIRRAQKMLFTYCFESDDEKYCERFVNILWDMARLIAKTRISDLLEDTKKREGLDSDLYDYLERMITYYSRFLGGFYRISEQGRIMVYVVKPIAHPESGAKLESGDYVFMRPASALALAAAGYVSPVELVPPPAEKD